MPRFFYFQRFWAINPVISRLSIFLINHFRPISGHFRLRKLGMKQEVFCLNWGRNRRTSATLKLTVVGTFDFSFASVNLNPGGEYHEKT